ncbi:hypothetical protein CONLIGDRAFT_679685 [Coniochaeta ligniaria NRRL 30616]|uniref:Uncharacterized protein n=1 Tax=Coniochaeta ligniaria NRRL 30616 TaxID=1408157 RepID=A0A1J7ITV7_9PEZI|nr:hypothetical protein CONLIGDRAFT_679685 [Coniochaeta ligniaria NRRL 30616]
MQRCRAWLRLHGITSKPPAPSNNAGPDGHDCEPPPYHDLRTTTGPAADIASITSAISTVAITLPSCFVSMDTRSVAKMISRMALAISTTPHARDYRRRDKPADCATGTAEALMTGIDSYLEVVFMQLAWGDAYWLKSSLHSRHDALRSISKKATRSPLASARIIEENLTILSFGIEVIVSYVQPVACAPATAAAITSALANVAKAVAAAPEESMAAIAELYASYARRAAHSIAGGILDAQWLRDGRDPASYARRVAHSIQWQRDERDPAAFPLVASHLSGLKSSAANESRLKNGKAPYEVQSTGPLTLKDQPGVRGTTAANKPSENFVIRIVPARKPKTITERWYPTGRFQDKTLAELLKELPFGDDSLTSRDAASWRLVFTIESEYMKTVERLAYDDEGGFASINHD